MALVIERDGKAADRAFVPRLAERSKPERNRLATAASIVAIAAFVLVWSQTLAPKSIGGSAGFVMVRGVSMLPTFRGGDLVVTHASASYRKGDIIAYTVPKGEFGAAILVIHRIIGGSAASGFVIQGDNNGFTDPWHPKPKDIVGKAWVHVPRLGLLLAFLHAPVPLASLAAGVVVALIVVPPKKKKPEQLSTVNPSPQRVRDSRRPRVTARHIRVAAAIVVGAASIVLMASGGGVASRAQTPPHTKAPESCLASDRPSTEAEMVNLRSTCALAGATSGPTR